MRYLLDTNVCIQCLKGSKIIEARMQGVPRRDIVVCSLVKSELLFGSLKSKRPVENLKAQSEFLKPYESVPFDDRCVAAHAKIQWDLTRKGTLIGPNDSIIAAIALAYDLTLITHNTREFSRVEGLRLEDWEL